jgi:hypothetical protein
MNLLHMLQLLVHSDINLFDKYVPTKGRTNAVQVNLKVNTEAINYMLNVSVSSYETKS